MQGGIPTEMLKLTIFREKDKFIIFDGILFTEWVIL